MAISFNESPFETLSPQLRAQAEATLKRRTYRKGDHMYEEGQPHQGLMWFRSGVAISYKRGSDGSYELAVPVYRGLWTAPSLLVGVHAASQRAVTDCIIDIVEPADSAKLSEESHFNDLVARWCGEDYRLMMDATAAVNRTRTEDKILAWVRHTIKFSGYDPYADETALTGTLEWPFSISQMAEYMRVSRPHLSTVIGRLAQQRRMEIKGRRLTVF